MRQEFDLAERSFAEGDYLTALENFLLCFDDFEQAIYNAANCAYLLGEYRTAEALFRVAIRRGVKEAFLNLGLTLVESGRHLEAITYFEQAWQVSETADCAQAAARAFAASGGAIQAIDWYRKATGNDDAAIEAFELLSEVEGREPALAFLRDLAPGRPNLLLCLADALTDDGGGETEAIAVLRSALSLGQGSAAVGLANLLTSRGDDALAIDVLREGVSLQDRRSANNLALRYWLDGRRSEAVELWRLSARNGDRLAKKNLRRRGVTTSEQPI